MKDVRAGWFNAFRPWSLHGAVIPVLIGGAVAYGDGEFCWWIFVLILIGGCLLQSAANLLNTYGDFVKGTDTVDNEKSSPELVTGILNPKKVKLAGIVCLAIVALIGAVFIWYIGLGILFFGIVGIAGAGLYTVGVAYKYHAMGLISCFIMMGLLMPLGTYYTMTGCLSWEPLLMGLPNAFLITAVLNGNETRDYFEDRDAGVGTLSGHLSYENSVRFYLFMSVFPFFLLAALIIFQAIPWVCAVAFLAVYDLYLLYGNAKHVRDSEHNSRMLVPLAFKLNWHFGVLLTAGYLLAYYTIGVAI